MSHLPRIPRRVRRSAALPVLLSALLSALLPALPAAAATPGPVAGAAPALEACRLEHPLALASFAARCGELEVPLDPAAPRGERIRLSFALVPALDRRSHAPPLVILAGGPGQSAGDLYTSQAGAFARIAREHTIVLLDQRGTGRSQRLDCDLPDEWQEASAGAAALEGAARACLAHLGERVRFFTSSVAVRDLEALRVALGLGAIDLYGSSYGTRVAELYVRRYPRAVQAMILDGVTYPQQIIGPDSPLDGQRALDLIVGRCRASADCAHAFPQLAAEVAALEQRYGAAHRTLSLVDPVSGAPRAVEFDHDLLAASLRLLSYGSAGASLLPTLVHEAAGERLSPLAAQTLLMAREVRAQLAAGMQMSVVCSEDVPFYGAVDRRRLAATYQGTTQLDALESLCRPWPRGPVDADLHEPLRSGVPALLLSGEADPVTPPADAERLARGLARVRHLVLAGEGHGQLATGCVPQLMERFLARPDPGALDATCLAAHRPPPFFVSAVGPAP